MKQIKFILLGISLLMALAAPSAMGQNPILVSVNSAGTASGSSSTSYDTNPVISADGRFVAFESYATNLVPNDGNNDRDVFVRDLVAGTTRLVSINSAGTGSGNDESYYPSISADGRFVAFLSRADNLVTIEDNGYRTPDVFVRDLVAGTTTLVSINTSGTSSTGGAASIDVTPIFPVVISADGRFVAFENGSPDLVTNDTNFTDDIFVRDLAAGTTTLVSVDPAGTGSGNRQSYGPRINSNGRFIAFESLATNLVANDTNTNTADVFVRDLVTGTTHLVSINSAETASGNGPSYDPSISDDGRFVAFGSEAGNLVTNDTNNTAGDVFVRDLVAGTTSLISINSAGTGSGNGFGSFTPVISGNGRHVTFTSSASNLTTNDTNGFGPDVFVRDRQTSVTELVSVNDAGTGSGNSDSYAPSISADGRFIAFKSYATDLVTIDNNPYLDVYVRDTIQNRTTLMSVNSAGTASGNSDSAPNSTPMISADGRFVTFDSYASDLVTNDTNTEVDIFAVAVPAVRLQFSAATYSIGESKGAATITVTRTGGSDGEAHVNYATIPGRATPGVDYTPVSGRLDFADGEVSKTFTVPILDDTLDEANETIILKLVPVDDTTPLGAQARSVLTILDNDRSPAISINDQSVTEGDSGAINATFTVSLSAVSGQPVTVKYMTVNGSAIAGRDYTAKSGTLTFSPGQTTKSVAIQVKGDTLRESNETFKVFLGTPTNATIADSLGIGTIINDD